MPRSVWVLGIETQDYILFSCLSAWGTMDEHLSAPSHSSWTDVGLGSVFLALPTSSLLLFKKMEVLPSLCVSFPSWLSTIILSPCYKSRPEFPSDGNEFRWGVYLTLEKLNLSDFLSKWPIELSDWQSCRDWQRVMGQVLQLIFHHFPACSLRYGLLFSFYSSCLCTVLWGCRLLFFAFFLWQLILSACYLELPRRPSP